MTAPLVILATLAVVAGFVGSPLSKYAFGKFLGEHAEGEMNYLLAAIAVGAALAGIFYAYNEYYRRGARTDWYLKSRYVSSPLTRGFWIDDAYQHLIITPALLLGAFFRRVDIAVVDGVVRGFGWIGLKISGVLAVFDRRVVDGAVDGLGDGVTERRPAGPPHPDRQRADLPAAARRVHRRPRPGVRTMSGLPVLSIVVMAPVVGAVLIALLGKNPKVPRAIALFVATVSLVGAGYVYATYDRAAGRLPVRREGARGSRRSACRTRSASTGSRCRCWCSPRSSSSPACSVRGTTPSGPREFFALLLLLVTGVLGVFASLDAFLLFFFYEMAVLPMYLLIAIWGSTRKEYSAMKLTLFLFAGSAILILLLTLTYWQVGLHTFDMRVWAAHSFGADVPEVGVPARAAGLRHADPDLAAAHVVARRPRGRAHRGLDAARRRAAEARRVRLHPPRAHDVPLGVARLVVADRDHRRDQRGLRRVLRDEPDRPEVRHRLLEREPHGLRAAGHRDGRQVRTHRRRVPDVRARHHDRAVLRAHRLRLRADAHPGDRRHLRAHEGRAARRRVLRDRRRLEHGPAVDRGFRRRAAGLRRARHRRARGSPRSRSSAWS